MPLHLLDLPEDLLQHIHERADLKSSVNLHRTCQELWRRHRRTRCGVSLAGLAPSMSTKDVNARFGVVVRPLLATLSFCKIGNARWYATPELLGALLHAHGGWKGVKALLDVPAERAAAAVEKETQAFHNAVVQLEEFCAASRKIPFEGFFAWNRASHADGLRSPTERPETRAFLTGTPRRPPFARVRRELELYAGVQARCKERRAVLLTALAPYGLGDLPDDEAYRLFCDMGPVDQAPKVALELARRRGLVPDTTHF